MYLKKNMNMSQKSLRSRNKFRVGNVAQQIEFLSSSMKPQGQSPAPLNWQVETEESGVQGCRQLSGESEANNQDNAGVNSGRMWKEVGEGWWVRLQNKPLHS